MKTAAAAGLTAPLVLRSSLRAAAANSRLHHACIGVAGMGGVDLENFLKHPRVRIVALCDVDASHLQQAAGRVPEARRYADWRELLEKEGDGIDSVTMRIPNNRQAERFLRREYREGWQLKMT